MKERSLPFLLGIFRVSGTLCLWRQAIGADFPLHVTRGKNIPV